MVWPLRMSPHLTKPDPRPLTLNRCMSEKVPYAVPGADARENERARQPFARFGTSADGLDGLWTDRIADRGAVLTSNRGVKGRRHPGDNMRTAPAYP